MQDLAGNSLASAVTTTFTTETGVDAIRPTVTAVDPASGATDVPTNAVARVEFSEVINPLTVTPSTFFVERTTGGTVRVPGTATVAADGLSATYTPDDPLSPSTSYRVRTFNGITDLAGQTLSSTSIRSNFTTAP